MLVISGPAMVIAYLKLRKRNLGPILDANGWAINTVAKMNVPFGASLTDLPRLPAGAERSLEDPYAEKRSPWPKIIVFLIVLAIAYAVLNRFGLIHEWTGGRLGNGPAAAVRGSRLRRRPRRATAGDAVGFERRVITGDGTMIDNELFADLGIPPDYGAIRGAPPMPTRWISRT